MRKNHMLRIMHFQHRRFMLLKICTKLFSWIDALITKPETKLLTNWGFPVTRWLGSKFLNPPKSPCNRPIEERLKQPLYLANRLLLFWLSFDLTIYDWDIPYYPDFFSKLAKMCAFNRLYFLSDGSRPDSGFLPYSPKEKDLIIVLFPKIRPRDAYLIYMLSRYQS